MEITYIAVGDHLLPGLVLSDPPDAPPLGLYGTLHKKYLEKHRPILQSWLVLSEQLYPLCRAVDEAAAHRMETIGDREIAHEVILSELVYE